MIIPTMLLVSGELSNGTETFKMISINPDCPYNEAIFIPETGELEIISKQKKECLTGTSAKTVERWYEYELRDPNEIKEFIELFAINKDFDISRFIKS